MTVDETVLLEGLDAPNPISTQIVNYLEDRKTSVFAGTAQGLNSSSQSASATDTSTAVDQQQLLLLNQLNALPHQPLEKLLATIPYGLSHIAPAGPPDQSNST